MSARVTGLGLLNVKQRDMERVVVLRFAAVFERR